MLVSMIFNQLIIKKIYVEVQRQCKKALRENGAQTAQSESAHLLLLWSGFDS